MSYQYDLYLQKHKANVKKGFDWLQTNMPWLFEGKPDAAWQTEFEHDASKSKPDEYEPMTLISMEATAPMLLSRRSKEPGSCTSTAIPITGSTGF